MLGLMISLGLHSGCLKGQLGGASTKPALAQRVAVAAQRRSLGYRGARLSEIGNTGAKKCKLGAVDVIEPLLVS